MVVLDGPELSLSLFLVSQKTAEKHMRLVQCIHFLIQYLRSNFCIFILTAIRCICVFVVEFSIFVTCFLFLCVIFFFVFSISFDSVCTFVCVCFFFVVIQFFFVHSVFAFWTLHIAHCICQCMFRFLKGTAEFSTCHRWNN